MKALKTFEKASIDLVMTSPPYWSLLDYGVPGQIGQGATVPEYVARLDSGKDAVKAVLKKTGSLYLNLGDTYVEKMVPARVALTPEHMAAGRRPRRSPPR